MTPEEAIEIIATLIPKQYPYTHAVIQSNGKIKEEPYSIEDEAKDWYDHKFSSGNRRLTVEELIHMLSGFRNARDADIQRKQEAFRVLCEAIRS